MVVERTFAWQSQNRRLSKDYERLCTTCEALIYVAMIPLMVRRLARRGRFFRRFLTRRRIA
jgi:transposase